MIVLTGATAQLDGVVLQWTRTIEPHGLNFVEYRRVENLTRTISELDYSPYLTLPMTFESGNTRVFKVPKEWLEEGAHYEFRMAYPFLHYTYLTNSLVVKTFDASSPFVSSVTWMATHERMELTWKAPEHSAGLIGYDVRILYKAKGNGDLLSPLWVPSELTVLGQTQVDLISRVVTIGCRTEGSKLSVCLTPFTIYYVELSVIREGGADAPRHFYIPTTLADKRLSDYAEFSVYSGIVLVHFAHNVSTEYAAGTMIASTILNGSSLVSKQGDFSLSLNNSVVESVSSSELRISIGQSELSSFVTRVLLSPFTSSGFELVMGTDGTAIPLTDYGLSDGETLSCIDECCADAEASGCSICGEPTLLNAASFVSCRLRCVRPDIYGESGNEQVGVLTAYRVAGCQELCLGLQVLCECGCMRSTGGSKFAEFPYSVHHAKDLCWWHDCNHT